MGWKGLGQARLKRGGRRVDIVLGARGPNGEAWDAVGPRAWVAWTDKAGREESNSGVRTLFCCGTLRRPDCSAKTPRNTHTHTLS